MEGATLQFKNADLLAKALEAMPKKMERRVLQAAVNKAAEPVIRQASANAPVNSGLLAKSESARHKTYSSGFAVAVVGAVSTKADVLRRRLMKQWRKKHAGVEMIDVPARIAKANPAKYAHLVEFGTKPHPIGKGIKAKARRALSRILSSAGISAQRGMHPGTPPRPFLRPAFEQNASRSMGIIEDEVGKAIQQHGLEAFQYVGAGT